MSARLSSGCACLSDGMSGRSLGRHEPWAYVRSGCGLLGGLVGRVFATVTGGELAVFVEDARALKRNGLLREAQRAELRQGAVNLSLERGLFLIGHGNLHHAGIYDTAEAVCRRVLGQKAPKTPTLLGRLIRRVLATVTFGELAVLVEDARIF